MRHSWNRNVKKLKLTLVMNDGSKRKLTLTPMAMGFGATTITDGWLDMTMNLNGLPEDKTWAEINAFFSGVSI